MPYPETTPQPGEIYRVNLDPVVGSEQGRRRPVVVVSPEVIQGTLPIVLIAPITSKIKGRGNPISPILSAGEPLPQESAVLTFQVRTLDQTRLEKYLGSLTDDQMGAVRRGLAVSFGLVGPSAPASS
ncbi:MAG: type II toxin-antitoxin system PemK/MazF family toxin [Acidimicrobiales bacterium]